MSAGAGPDSAGPAAAHVAYTPPATAGLPPTPSLPLPAHDPLLPSPPASPWAQLEEFDAELEGLAGQKGKKGGKPPPRVAHLEESVARHRHHVMRLEQMLRLLDNDAIGPEDVDSIKVGRGGGG